MFNVYILPSQKRLPIKIFRHKELTQTINGLSEEIEGLKTRKNIILTILNTNDIRTVKAKITDIQKAVPVMERHSNESKAKLDNAQKEYTELKERAQELDTEELQNLRYDIRTGIESETISELQKKYGGSFIPSIYETAKSETDKSIGETDRYSVRKQIENIKLKKVCKKPKMFIANTIKKTNGKHNSQDIIEQIGS